MCRIFGFSGKADDATLLEALNQFGALAESGVVPNALPPGHRDGWGLVAYKNSQIGFFEKYPESASGSDKYAEAARKISAIEPDTVIGHLRKASVGGLNLENTHPFVIGEWSFCHNGSIGKKGDMAGLPLVPGFLEKRKGGTDSESLFLYLLQSLGGVENPSDDVVRKTIMETIALIRAKEDYTALNLLLSNGKTLFVIREVNESNIHVKESNLCDTYYTLYIGKSADEKIKIICSERLNIPGLTWEAIPNQTVMVFDAPSD